MTGYLYNADGIRVSKGTITSWSCDPATSGFFATNDYILGQGNEQMSESTMNGDGSTLVWEHTNVWAGGRIIATYAQDNIAGQGQNSLLHFYLDDPLGSRRVQTDYAGVVEKTCQSLPFGDGETCLTTPTEHLFTGKERDAESGNDYFGARYYASSMGRWMSPDWSKTPSGVPYAILSNPQTLNLYSYVLNNPLTHFDPDGHACDSLWHCAQGFLNAVEVKVSASLGTQGSVQWGVAKAEYHATVVGVEGKSGLGGGNKDATVSTGVGASASASGGPVKASVSVNAGAQASTADGASASVSASAKVAMGPASGSASATMGTDGPSTSVGPGASADKDTDWKVGGSFTAGVGVGGDINFSQLGRAFSDAGDSLNALGSYLVDKYMPSGAPSSSGGAPGIPDPQHPF
jgi:RHS repeat-associated protein